MSLWAHPGCWPQVLSSLPVPALPRLSAGAARTSRGPWTSRALGMTTPSPMMSWMTSTQGRARVVSTTPTSSPCVGNALRFHVGWGKGEVRQGKLLDPRPRKGRTSSWGWNQGLETAELRTAHSPLFCLHSASPACDSADFPPLSGVMMLLSDPGNSTVLTSCRDVVASSGLQGPILSEITGLTPLGSGASPIQSPGAQGSFKVRRKVSTVPGSPVLWPGPGEGQQSGAK